MATTLTMTRTIRLTVAVLALACAHGLALAQVGKGVAEELMRKSGFWEQFDSVGTQIKAGLADAASKGGSRFSPSELDRLGKTIDSAYAPDRLRTTAVAVVARGTSTAQLADLRAWYDSPLGKEITAAEEAASGGAPRAPEDELREGMRVLSAATARRRALLERISQVTRAPEALAGLAINSAIAIQQGLASSGAATGMSPAEVRAALEAQRPQMVKAYAAMALASFATAYRNVADDDLDRYATFLASTSGRKFTDQCLLALDQAMAQAGRAFGQGMPAAKSNSNT